MTKGTAKFAVILATHLPVGRDRGEAISALRHGVDPLQRLDGLAVEIVVYFRGSHLL